MSLTLWEAHLADRSRRLQVVRSDGGSTTLPTQRWCGAPTAVDELLLSSLSSPVLDIGCGPGRLTAALHARGMAVLGIDVSTAAVECTRRAGGPALKRSIFDPLPKEGSWSSAVLADGNIGIGGDPGRLLSRIASLLRPGGSAHVEIEPWGAHDGTVEYVRLRLAGRPTGKAFRWARVSGAGINRVLPGTGLRLMSCWTAAEVDGESRSFATLQRSLSRH
jgi:SAM-dependent methyltransferase